jgi:hypothetical protein
VALPEHRSGLQSGIKKWSLIPIWARDIRFSKFLVDLKFTVLVLGNYGNKAISK